MVDYLDEFKQFLNEDEKTKNEPISGGDDSHQDNNANRNMDNNKQNGDESEEYEIIERESVFTINSKDRNLINETAFNFSINFGTNNPNKINISKNFRNIISIEFLGLIIPDFYVDIKELLTLFNKNLVNSSTKALRLKRIADLPYLLLNISELKNENSFGSNPIINKASYVLVLDEIRNMSDNNSGTYTKSGANFTENVNLDKTILADTNKRNLYYKAFSGSTIKYTSPQNYLGNIEISLTTPEGIPLSNLNDFLEVYRVYKIGDGTSAHPYRLRIKFYKYFSSDEYRIGDRIVFKDIGYTFDESLAHNEERVRNDPSLRFATEEVIQEFIQADKFKRENNGFTNPDYLDRYSLILQFLEREEGHTIIEVGGTPDGVMPAMGGQAQPPNLSKLFNEIGIAFDSQITLETKDNISGTSVLNTLEMSDTASAVLAFPLQPIVDRPLVIKDVAGTIYAGTIVEFIGSRRFDTRVFSDIDSYGLSTQIRDAGYNANNSGTGFPHIKSLQNDPTYGPPPNGHFEIKIIPPPLVPIPAGTEISFHNYLKDERLGPILFDPGLGYPRKEILTDPTQNIIFSKGKCINISNQITLGLKIKYQQRELKSLEGKLL